MKLTPIRAIKLYCKRDCCVDDMISWKCCNRKECPLFAYRLGKRPNVTNSMQKQADTTLKISKQTILGGTDDHSN